MLKLHKIFIYITLFASMAINPLLAQTAKESIFSDVQKMIDKVKEEGGELLSPEMYKKAMENFKEANDYYVNNESTRDIREKLTEAQKYCNRALEVIKLGTITLKDAMQAREDAMSVEAGTYAINLMKEAEEKFHEAALELEDGDIEDARDAGSEAESFYRQAELKSIKDQILGESRRLVLQAQNEDCLEFAPKSFQYAQTLLNEGEDMLTNNRYGKDEAKQKATECEYQAVHAMYLTQQIRVLRDDEKNWEKLILGYEDILTGFSAQFNEQARFEAGMNETVQFVQGKISKVQEENNRLMSQIGELQEEYNVVKEEATVSSAELAKKQEREAKIEKVKAMFSAKNAKVIFDGDNLVIRLHGLNFPTGKAIIQPEYFSLLTKVQDAIKVFPESHILVEGHTDSQGNANTNKSLSEERASAVREYILANMNIDRDQVTSIGYGSAKPVASNKTADGRALNRRIDVLIDLSID